MLDSCIRAADARRRAQYRRARTPDRVSSNRWATSRCKLHAAAAAGVPIIRTSPTRSIARKPAAICGAARPTRTAAKRRNGIALTVDEAVEAGAADRRSGVVRAVYVLGGRRDGNRLRRTVGCAATWTRRRDGPGRPVVVDFSPPRMRLLELDVDADQRRAEVVAAASWNTSSGLACIQRQCVLDAANSVDRVCSTTARRQVIGLAQELLALIGLMNVECAIKGRRRHRQVYPRASPYGAVS